jgi:RNA polymerase sigma factor (sigma-70 family)
MAGWFDRRSEDRFQREVLCHIDAAYNLARWLLGNDHDAEDAVQEASVKALRKFSSLRGEAKPWFLAIVRNACMNTIRDRNRRRGVEAEENIDLPSTSPTPHDLAISAYNADRIRDAIEVLPTAWKEMIILREFEQMSYRELSEVASIPIGTVMSRLSRARERLYELLCEEEGK